MLNLIPFCIILRYSAPWDNGSDFSFRYICSAQFRNCPAQSENSTLADRVRILTLHGSIPELSMHKACKVVIETKGEYLSIVTRIHMYFCKHGKHQYVKITYHAFSNSKCIRKISHLKLD